MPITDLQRVKEPSHTITHSLYTYVVEIKVAGSKASDLCLTVSLVALYINDWSQGFLLGSARDS